MTVAWTENELRAELNRYEDELRRAGKARNTITTYVQHPERFINWLVGRYDPGAAGVHLNETGPTGPRASRYDPLRIHLASRAETTVTMSFDEIEGILGRSLPASARRYRPWWANEKAGTHVHARAWLDAGRHTANVDLQTESLDFVRE